MQEKFTPSLKKPEILFLSFFGSGFAPFAPGTFGTAAILPFLALLNLGNAPYFFYIPIIIITTIFSCFLADKIQRENSLHDPQWIVIDEVLGMATAWLFQQNSSLSHLLILFLFFRFFDIIKIYPASYLDKKVTHGYGTILDDIVSGLYAGLLYLLLNKLNFFSFLS